jgi:glycosyltransferase involved in cell wall biosynthesis
LSKHYSIVQSDKDVAQATAIVGMAVYSEDRIDWVKQGLVSIENQTYKDFLLILVIDGDVSAEMEDFLHCFVKSNGRIVLVKNDENSGLSVSMNHVVDIAKTYSPSYFFRMDADDISLPDRFAKQIAFLEKNPKISILGTSLTEVNEAGKTVGKRNLPLKHGEILRFLPKRCSINHPTVSIRFSVFEQGFRYRESVMNTQDYFFWADLAAAGFKFANLKQKLLKFRRVNDFYKRRGFSKSINEFKARFYTMKVLKKYSIGNIIYAFAVLGLRLMPARIVKVAYKIDRYFLNKRVKHD